jgi:hypothetical protein
MHGDDRPQTARLIMEEGDLVMLVKGWVMLNRHRSPM